MKRFTAAALAAALALSGCAGVPQVGLDMKSAAATGIPQSVTVSDIMDEVACELVASKALAGETVNHRHFIATANLLLQVDESAGVTPNLNSISPYAVSGTNLTTSLGAELTSTKQRTFSSTFVIDVSALQDAAHGGFDPKTACRSVTTATSATATRASPGNGATRLEGDLGLEDIINTGVQSFETRHYVVDWDEENSDLGSDQKNTPSFGSTIQFTLRKSISNLGPTWTLRRFKGPGGGNAGLVNGSHTDTNKLVITFAPFYLSDEEQTCEKVNNHTKPAIEAYALLFSPAELEMADEQKQAQVETHCNKLGSTTRNKKSMAADASRNQLNTMILQNALPNVQAH